MIIFLLVTLTTQFLKCRCNVLLVEWIHGFEKLLAVHPVDHDEVHHQVCGVSNKGARRLLQLQTCCRGYHHRRRVLQVRICSVDDGVVAAAF